MRLSRTEIKHRQERVLTLLRREKRWISTQKVATGSDLSYDIVRRVLATLLKQGLVEFQLGARNVSLWGLAGLSAREQAAQLETSGQQKINALDEHKIWLEAVARQKAWRKRMELLENRQ